jgi:hypothetical protein
MLIAVHPMHATLAFPFTPLTWQQVADSSFGDTNINALHYTPTRGYTAVGNLGKVCDIARYSNMDTTQRWFWR